MKRVVFLVVSIASLALLISCATNNRMYCWENYDRSVAEYLSQDNPDTKAMQNLANEYAKMIKKQESSSRGVVPPGVYADYYYLLLKIGNKKEGILYLNKEMEAYPESAKFIGKVLEGL